MILSSRHRSVLAVLRGAPDRGFTIQEVIVRVAAVRVNANEVLIALNDLEEWDMVVCVDDRFRVVK